MKQLKSGIYKASNVDFDPNTLTAHSYGWWQFVRRINDKVVFNVYAYSKTTQRHQNKVMDLMERLGIKIDVLIHTSVNLTNLNALHDARLQMLKSIYKLNEEINNPNTKSWTNINRQNAVNLLTTELINLENLIAEMK